MGRKRILIFGAGVIGSVYAGKLALAGHDVSVLARNRRLSELQRNGLVLLENGKERVHANITVISELRPDDIYDYVLVTLRADHLKDALAQLVQNRSQHFVFMVNTSRGYSEWANAMGMERIVPAFPGAGGKIENGIVHYSLTSQFIQPTTLGEIDGSASPRINELVGLFRNAGFSTSISKKIDSWQKSHVALVCPLAYGIYYDGGNNYTFAKNRKAIVLMNKALTEAFRFLHDSGIGVEPFKLNLFRWVPLRILNLIVPIVFNTKWAETVISDHALTARAEMEMLFNDFVLLAKDKGYDLKELKRLRTE